MRSLLAFVLVALLSVAASAQPADPVVLVIHGGAGTMSRASMTAEREASIRGSLEQALQAGHTVIESGAPAMDAVLAAIQVLEEDSQFNAGRGGVFAADGTVRHDASVMDGATGLAGASAGTMHVRSPIHLARAVMDASPHVMLTEAGAEEFALQQGLELVPNTYFHTESRRASLDRVQQREREQSGAVMGLRGDAEPQPWQMHGTVGAVALDANGHLAAGTSTGGMTNKRWGRVGDAPIIGAGTYADDATCGVSATGWGEYFIRLGVARDISARMEYLGESVDEAATHVINTKLETSGGTGGVIALDREGNVSMPFNTEGMYRATITRSGVVTTGIYGDE
ncbi:MAG: isoaspartyl peptidase/L-asparaginase [Rubricoccaceae bacterium]